MSPIAIIGNFPITALAAFPGLGLNHATVNDLLQRLPEQPPRAADILDAASRVKNPPLP